MLLKVFYYPSRQARWRISELRLHVSQSVVVFCMYLILLALVEVRVTPHIGSVFLTLGDCVLLTSLASSTICRGSAMQTTQKQASKVSSSISVSFTPLLLAYLKEIGL